MLQYRVTWSASSNISFHGETDWRDWDDPEASEDDIRKALDQGSGISDALEEAIQESGFEWIIEVREAADK